MLLTAVQADQVVQVVSGTTAGSQIVLLRHGVLLEDYTSSDLLIVLYRTAEIPAMKVRSYICYPLGLLSISLGSIKLMGTTCEEVEGAGHGKAVERPQKATQMKDLGCFVNLL